MKPCSVEMAWFVSWVFRTRYKQCVLECLARAIVPLCPIGICSQDCKLPKACFIYTCCIILRLICSPEKNPIEK